MNSTQRIKTLLAQGTVDRTPIAGWQHNSLVDRDAEKLIEATINFTERNEWDIIKIMSQPQYMAEAYGDIIEFPENDNTRLCGITKKFTIHSKESLANLKEIDMDNSVFQREVKTAKGLVEHYKGTKAILPTFFTPLSWLKLSTSPIESIAGLDYSSYTVPTVSDYLKNHKDELKLGLDAIQKSNKNLVDAFIDAGVDGIFLASQYSTRELIVEKEFKEFEEPYILDLLNYIKDRTWFNVLHVHGTKNLMLDQVLDYPVQALNWEDHAFGVEEEYRTRIREIRNKTDKVIMGGIDRVDDFSFSSDMNKIKERLREKYVLAVAENMSKNFVFAPGCGILSNKAISKEAIALVKEVVK